MKIPTNLKCEKCLKIFCCPQCRVKHEINFHVAEGKVISCPICCGISSYPLHKTNRDHLFDHIVQHHLPLHCAKCLKTFKDKDDFQNLVGCTLKNDICTLKNEAISEEHKDDVPSSVRPVNQDKEVINTPTETITTNEDAMKNVTFQMSKSSSDKYVTPNISDSVSSIRNVSSINGSSNQILQKTASPNKKLVRQTSTPMHRIVYTVKKNSFDSMTSSCQMSSIEQSNSDSDVSPPVSRSSSESSPSVKMVRSRHKLPPSATPLRQVMSKSIQKAIIEHGLPILHRKPGYSPGGSLIAAWTPPLDLRTSAVIRRTKSESDQFIAQTSQPIINQSDELSTSESSINSVNIHISVKSSTRRSIHASSTRRSIQTSSSLRSTSSSRSIQSSASSASVNGSDLQLNTVYETCRFMENSQDLSELLQTPKTSGGNLKKTKSFADRSSKENQDDDDDDDDANDVWYTPSTGVPQTNCCPELLPSDTSNRRSRRMLIKDQPVDLTDHSSDVSDYEGISKPKGKLWSLVSSVVRMASFSNSQIDISDNQSILGTGVKRWASFSGYTKKVDNQSESDSDTPPHKRRRTTTVSGPIIDNPSKKMYKSLALIKPPKRIQGRMPIERMRKTNNDSK